jgi:alpha-N-arabinofuranosidase
MSQGGAYVHNLIAGEIHQLAFDGRMTPFHKAHSTEVAGLHDNPCGDDRFYNNLFVQNGDLSQYDTAKLPMWMNGNVFLKGTKPSKHETEPLLKPEFDPKLNLIEKADGFYLELILDKVWSVERTRKLVTTDMLGKVVIPNLPYEHPDGSLLRVDTDYFGKKRNEKNPSAGPFENSAVGKQLTLKVW